MWTQPKDVNYYGRLSLINKIKKYVDKNLTYGVPLPLNPPIPFTYNGGKKSIINIERYQYISCFKKEFKTIRVQLDDGTYVRLIDLRMKHLLKIFEILHK